VSRLPPWWPRSRAWQGTLSDAGGTSVDPRPTDQGSHESASNSLLRPGGLSGSGRRFLRSGPLPSSPPRGCDPTCHAEGRSLSRSIRVDVTSARAPIWQGRGARVQQAHLYGRPCRVRFAGEVVGPLTATDLRIWMELVSRWDAAARPPEREVTFAMRELASTLGYRGYGGRQAQLVASSLERLQAVSIKSAIRYSDGPDAYRSWSLLEACEVTDADVIRSWARISLEVAQRIEGHGWTWVELPIYDALRTQDELAARLWLYLRSERLKTVWRYPLFDRGAPTDAPPIASLLGLHSAKVRSVLARVREAAALVSDCDSRFELGVELDRKRKVWNLTAVRRPARQPQCSRQVPGVQPEIVNAWGSRYHGLPSRSQVGILVELLTRWTSAEGSQILLEAKEDPLREWMSRDRQRSRDRLCAAAIQERTWAATKASEEAVARGGMVGIGETLAQIAAARIAS